MVATFGNYLWFFFLPLYYESRFGASPLQLSVVYGAWLLAVGVGIAPAGALADIIGRKPVIVTSGLITSSAAFILAFSNNFVLAAFALPLTGFGSSFLQMSYVMVGESVESGRRGVAYGTYQTFANIMAAFSPFAGGLTIFRSASYFQVFVIGGSLTLVATVLRALFSQGDSPSREQDQRKEALIPQEARPDSAQQGIARAAHSLQHVQPSCRPELVRVAALHEPSAGL